MKFELNKNQMESLQVFLNRVNLRGGEVPQFNDLLRALSTPIEEKPEKKEKV
jgi:hypothetical protein